MYKIRKKYRVILAFLIFFIFLEDEIYSSQKPKIKDHPPIARIIAPKSGKFFTIEEKIKFEGDAIDLEDEEIPEEDIIWESDLDGQIGKGRFFIHDSLSLGSHIITLTAKDSAELKGKHLIFIRLELPNQEPISETEPNQTPNQEQVNPKQLNPTNLDPNSTTNIKVDPNSLPSIEFTSIPEFGSFDKLKGKISDPNLQEVAVTVLIMKEVAWFTKPSQKNPVTKINKDGSWECDITTEDSDHLATKIAVYLIPLSYKPPILTGVFRIPLDLGKNSLGKIEVIRKLTLKRN